MVLSLGHNWPKGLLSRRIFYIFYNINYNILITYLLQFLAKTPVLSKDNAAKK